MLSTDPGDGPGSFLSGGQPPSPRKACPTAGAATPGSGLARARRSRTLCPFRRWRTAARSSVPAPSPGAARAAGSAAAVNRGATPRARRSSGHWPRSIANPADCPACSPSSPPPGCGSRCLPATAFHRRRRGAAPAHRLPGRRVRALLHLRAAAERLGGPRGRGRARRGDGRSCPGRAAPAQCRTSPVPAAGGRRLAARLPAAGPSGVVRLASTPTASPGLPLYPECVPYLARLTAPAILGLAGTAPPGGLAWSTSSRAPGPGCLIGHPPAEPSRCSPRRGPRCARCPSSARPPGPGCPSPARARASDRRPARRPGQRAGSRGRDRRHRARRRAVALRVPFTVDRHLPRRAAGPDAIDAWIAGNTRPFYARA